MRSAPIGARRRVFIERRIRGITRSATIAANGSGTRRVRHPSRLAAPESAAARVLRKRTRPQCSTDSPSFADLGVPSRLVDVLVADGRPTAFPIQEATLPSTLAGRDVLGRGKTGSGKTLAFAIPMVARIAESGSARRGGMPSGLILAPTRELATQIARVVEPLAQAVGLKTTTVFGGVSQRPQETALRGGVDIVVACPGRLEDLISQKIVSLERVTVTVLDEADHMADLGFLPGVTRLLSQTPGGGQRLFFSATLDNGIDKLVRRFLSEPVHHSVDSAESPVSAMTHHVFEAGSTEAKTELVRTLASGRARRLLCRPARSTRRRSWRAS